MPHVDGGFVLLARRFFTNADGEPSWTWKLSPERIKIILWLIRSARWQATPRTVYTTRGPIKIGRGQLWTTYSQIAKGCGLGKECARRCVELLADRAWLTPDYTPGLGLLITITNYDTYQDVENYRRQTSRAVHARPTPDPPRNHASTLKNLKKGRKNTEGSDPPADAVLALTCTRGEQWHLTRTQIGIWAQAFPGIDVLQQVRHAAAWMDANPNRRKTRRGMPRFLVNWLGKAQNQSRGQSARAAEPTLPKPIPFENRLLTPEELAARGRK